MIMKKLKICDPKISNGLNPANPENGKSAFPPPKNGEPDVLLMTKIGMNPLLSS